MNNNQIQQKNKPQFFTDFDLQDLSDDLQDASDFSGLDKLEQQKNFFQQDLSLYEKPVEKKQTSNNIESCGISYGHCNIEMPALDEYDLEDEFFLQFGL